MLTYTFKSKHHMAPQVAKAGPDELDFCSAECLKAWLITQTLPQSDRVPVLAEEPRDA